MRSFSKAMRPIALATALAILGGCSEYLDRRETIALSGGNAVATNVVTHMVDPWPRESANRNIAFNGARIEGAFERYRTNRVTAPRGIGTSSTYQEPAPAAAPSAPAGSAMTAPAAAVK
jgi:hypothetical protein